MKNTLIVMMVALTSTAAMADGFLCTSQSGLNIKVYNHTDANKGTRTGATMVVSDSAVGSGNKTIAKFTDLKGTLSSESVIYVGNVDLRFSDSSRKGELIGGTKLGQLDQIKLVVWHNYSLPVADGAKVAATLLLEKRNGDVIREKTNCIRYLKN